ncbi:MAG: type II secretion system F family protein [Candidatus Ryanbacteria bacterium]|nr:type II secretion system F family protein [Candidatus Ryanbacteria bacterium]
MIFGYQARTTDGHQRTGTIDAPSAESAVQALQRQNLVVVSLKSAAEGRSILDRFAARFHFIKQRDVALLARQLSTLFDAKVPVIRTFQTVIGESAANPLRVHLSGVLDDVQGGTSMSQAMAKHPQVFSAFFVSMVHAGEESGKLDEVFAFLADYLERSYQTTTKVRNALIYPAFIFLAFIGVMVFMLTNVIPKVSAIIVESGQALPIYTRIIIGVSNFFTNFGVLILLFVIALLFFLWRYLKTSDGIRLKARVEISIPVIGNLYKKLYLSRIADNLQTLVAGGIPIVRSLEITSDVVGNVIYRDIVCGIPAWECSC